MVDLSKRSWIAPQLRGTLPLRPPWSLDEAEFLSRCTSCNACVEACPENLIVRAGGGYPQLDFSRAECTFCESCVNTCPHGALDITRRPIIAQRPAIKDGCFARQGIYCSSCADVCDQAAIRFVYDRESHNPAIALPVLNLDHCNGCGACVSTCPADAIQFVPAAHPSSERKNCV